MTELQIKHRFYKLKARFYELRVECMENQIKTDCADIETCQFCDIEAKQNDAHAEATLFWEEHKEIGLY